jgi:hypothetical protein
MQTKKNNQRKKHNQDNEIQSKRSCLLRIVDNNRHSASFALLTGPNSLIDPFLKVGVVL